LAFDNSGAVEVQSGNLGLGTRDGSLSTGSGSFDAPSGYINFYGAWTLTSTSSIDAAEVGFNSFFGTVASSYQSGGTSVPDGSAVTMTGTVTSLGDLFMIRESRLDLTGASLTATAPTLHSFLIDTSTLVFAENISINGPFFVQHGARLSSPNSNTLTAAAGLTLGQATLDGVELSIPTGVSAAWAGSVQLLNGAALENAGTLETTADTLLTGDSASAFLNSGTVQVQGGRLAWNAATSRRSGSLNTARLMPLRRLPSAAAYKSRSATASYHGRAPSSPSSMTRPVSRSMAPSPICPKGAPSGTTATPSASPSPTSVARAATPS
jgi:hypothetical protein